MSLFRPLVAFEAIDRDALNRALVDWGHKMGPLHRPRFGIFGSDHGLFHEGHLVAVVATEQMIAAETCGLSRDEAFELARVCAVRPDLCRAIVRIWREFAFPCFAGATNPPRSWAISYQDAVEHTGGLYRLDGWVRLGETRSGSDQRGREGRRRGRTKVVWGWNADPAARAAARAADLKRQADKAARRAV